MWHSISSSTHMRVSHVPSRSNSGSLRSASIRKSSIKLFMSRATSVKPISPRKKESTACLKNQKSSTIFVQVVDRPARKMILKRGYPGGRIMMPTARRWAARCGMFSVASSRRSTSRLACGCLKSLRSPGTSIYAQGVEVPLDYCRSHPAGFELMTLSPCKMMIFQGEPYETPN